MFGSTVAVTHLTRLQHSLSYQHDARQLEPRRRAHCCICSRICRRSSLGCSAEARPAAMALMACLVSAERATGVLEPAAATAASVPAGSAARVATRLAAAVDALAPTRRLVPAVDEDEARFARRAKARSNPARRDQSG